MNWWQSLSQIEQVLFVISVGSFFVLVAKCLMSLFEIYKINKLSTEDEDLEEYDHIANEDSDIEKAIPKYFSLVSINLFLFVLGTTRVVFKLFLSGFWLLALNYFASALVFVLYSFFKIKR